jgi:hypothetical protein
MARKQGNLRVRKGTAVFGPMTRADLVKLVESGRVSPTDEVSAGEEPWRPIGEYLQATTDSPPAPQDSGAWKVSRPATVENVAREKPCLRVAHGDRLYPPMTRRQVSQLFEVGRLSDDDLIAVIDGPWMRLADFFTPSPESAPRGAPAAETPGRPVESLTAAAVPQPEVVHANLEEVVDELEVVDEPAPTFTYESPTPVQPAARSMTPIPILPDRWFVRVRGIPSCMLQKHHIRTLLKIREISPNSVAAHASWPAEKWLPLREIPQMADLIK